MIKYELKKILGNRFVVFFFLLMFAVNAVLSAVSFMSIPASPETDLSAEDVQAMQEKVRVVNIQNGEQGVILRILSDTKPTENSVTVVPSLEDYYLHVFGDIL